MEPTELRTVLEPEPWGRRLERMRGERRQEQVAAVINAISDLNASPTDLSRLERHPMPSGPRSGRRLGIVFLACLVYGYDPRVLGLSLEVLPARLRDLGYEGVRELVTQTLRWIDASAGHELALTG